MRDRLTLLVATSIACSTLSPALLPNTALAAMRQSMMGTNVVAQAPEANPSPTPEGSPAAAPPGDGAAGDSGEASEEPALKLGDSGPEVRELQMRLERLKFYEGGITGEYDEATQAAVRSFQEKNELEATGIFNLDTWRKLEAIQNPRLQQSQRGLFRMSRKRALVLIAGGGVVLLLGSIVAIALLLRFINHSAAEPDTQEAEGTTGAAEASSSAFGATEPERVPLREVADPEVPEVTSPWGAARMPPVRSTAIPPGVTYPPAQAAELRSPQFEDVPAVPDPFPAPVQPEPESLAPPPAPATHRNGLTGASEPLPPLEPPPALAKLDRVDQLIRELREPDADQRQKAIWELAQQADSRAVQPLVNLLLDSDSQQQSLILEALSQIGTRALKPMNRALALSLQDDDAHVRRNAIRDLTRIYELVAQLSQLIYYATDDPDPDVQETARWALGQLNNIRVPQAARGDRPSPDC